MTSSRATISFVIFVLCLPLVTQSATSGDRNPIHTTHTTERIMSSRTQAVGRLSRRANASRHSSVGRSVGQSVTFIFYKHPKSSSSFALSKHSHSPWPVEVAGLFRFNQTIDTSQKFLSFFFFFFFVVVVSLIAVSISRLLVRYDPFEVVNSNLDR